MTSRCKLLAAMLAGLAFWLASGTARADLLGYTPTTTLSQKPGYPVGQMADLHSAVVPVNGFASYAKTGDITLTFPVPVDISEFRLFNNINTATGGVTAFKLKVYDAAGGVTTATYTNVPTNQAGPYTQGVSWSNVTKIVMTVISSDFAIEIRELEFEGDFFPIPSFTRTCADLQQKGLVLKTFTLTRTSGASPRPGAFSFPGSYPTGPLRPYGPSTGAGGSRRVFMDSFPLKTVNLCQVDVTVVGDTGRIADADAVAIFAAAQPGVIYLNGQFTGVGAEITPRKALPSLTGPWTYRRTLTGGDPAMRAALVAAAASASVGSIDVLVSDETPVTSTTVVYTYVGN